MDHKYYLGKCDYDHSGRKNCEAYLEWSFDGERFSMSAEIWNPSKTDIYIGGQCVDEVIKYFPHDEKAKRMAEIWQEWHLNDMQAGCEHQRVEKWKERRINLDDLPNCHANRDEKGILAIWVYPLDASGPWINDKDKHKDGLLTKPCPVCGYRYGSAWLKKEIPQAIKDEINSWSK